MGGGTRKKPRFWNGAALRAARLARLQRLLADDEALVSTLPAHLFWLGGFTGTTGALCVTKSAACFVTDPRYGEQAREEIAPCIHSVVSSERLERALAKLPMVKGVPRILLEEETCTLRDLARLREAFAGAEVRAAPSPITDLRRLKDPEEAAAIRAALALTEEAFAWIAPSVRPGVREIELAARLEYYARMKGAQGTAFTFIVASGPNSAKPHGVATGRAVQKNEVVQFDIGFVVDGYCSDFSRAVFCGTRPPAALLRLHALVEEAQRIGIAFIAAGQEVSRADREVRAFFKREGVLRQYLHTLGHGLGLEIHEAPRLSHKESGALLAGMAVTLEPGLYRAGKYGIRIEDVLLVTSGGAEVLTDFPRALARIPCV